MTRGQAPAFENGWLWHRKIRERVEKKRRKTERMGGEFRPENNNYW